MNLVPDSDPVLRQRTPEYDFAGDLTDLVAEMFTFMEANRGMGLAAPQIGMSLRFFIMRTTDGRALACFNPEIISVSEEVEKGEEGCLSFPDLWLKVPRPIRAEVRFADQHGNLVNETFENLDARCYLHETDHLNGELFVDRVGPLALKLAKDRRNKARR